MSEEDVCDLDVVLVCCCCHGSLLFASGIEEIPGAPWMILLIDRAQSWPYR